MVHKLKMPNGFGNKGFSICRSFNNSFKGKSTIFSKSEKKQIKDTTSYFYFTQKIKYSRAVITWTSFSFFSVIVLLINNLSTMHLGYEIKI